MKASESDESKPEGQQDVNDDDYEDQETHPQEMRAKEILRLTSPTVSVGIPSTIDSDQQRYSENQALITDSRGRVPSEKQNVMRETDTLDTIDGVTVGATRVRGPSYREDTSESEHDTLVNSNPAEVQSVTSLATTPASVMSTLEPTIIPNAYVVSGEMAQEEAQRPEQNTTTPAAVVRAIPDHRIIWWRRKSCWIPSILSLCIIAIVLGVTLSLTQYSAPPLASQTSSPATTQPPSSTPSPTPMTDFQRVRNAVRETFGEQSVSQIEINGRQTPQFRAAEWIVEIDTLLDSNNLLDTVASTIRFQQRYALAVFAYSLDVVQWRDSSGWLNGSAHECTWSGIACDDSENPGFIKSIKFTENFLRGTIPSEVGGLRFLSQFWIVDSGGVTGTIPSELAAIEPLRRLRLRNLNLNGTIPVEFNGKYNLEFLYLDRNKLTGTIPSQVGNLPVLDFLYLYDNQLRGTLPSSLIYSTSLRQLSVRNNILTGSFPDTDPSQSGVMGQMERLTLSQNHFEGKLPENLILLHNETLFSLLLNGNHFTGTIPTSWGIALPNLRAVSFAKNLLTGTVPPGFCRLRPNGTVQQGQLEQLDADCIANVTCDCCSACF